MAFENSSASGPVDLIQKLKTFLVANGWTSDASAADGAGWRVHLHKGAQYVHLRAQVNEVAPFQDNHGVNGYSIALYLGTAYVGGNAWNAQTAGAPVEPSTPTMPMGVGMKLKVGAIPNYYFFTDATNAHVVVVVEHLSGIFSHLGWGSSLSKIGTWTGGDYFFGTWSGFFVNDVMSPNTYAGDAATCTSGCPGIQADAFSYVSLFVRADVDSWTGKWVGLSDTTGEYGGYTGKKACSPIVGFTSSVGSNTAASQHTQFPMYAQNYVGGAGSFQHQQTSVLDARANLLPVLIYVERDGSGPGYSPLGTIPTVFCTSAVGQGFSPASDYVIGSDTYTMFPWFAVKKVV